MLEPVEVIELELRPVPPETVASARQSLKPLVEQTLRENGQENLLDEDIKIDIEKTFPVEGAIIVGLTFLSGVALETYKELILPQLKRRFEVKEQSKSKKSKKK